MRIDRKVIGRKDQLLVALPAAVRDHLSLVARARVYWHVTTKGAATLTASGRARGGRPRLDADCSSCAKYRQELDRLRGLLRGAHAGDYNSAFAQGVAHGVKIVPVWRAELDSLHAEVNDMRRLLAQLVVKLPDRKPRRRRDLAPSSHAEAERDPPYADDFDGEGRLIPRSVEGVELPPPPPDVA